MSNFQDIYYKFIIEKVKLANKAENLKERYNYLNPLDLYSCLFQGAEEAKLKYNKKLNNEVLSAIDESLNNAYNKANSLVIEYNELVKSLKYSFWKGLFKGLFSKRISNYSNVGDFILPGGIGELAGTIIGGIMEAKEINNELKELINKFEMSLSEFYSIIDDDFSNKIFPLLPNNVIHTSSLFEDIIFISIITSFLNSINWLVSWFNQKKVILNLSFYESIKVMEPLWIYILAMVFFIFYLFTDDNDLINKIFQVIVFSLTFHITIVLTNMLARNILNYYS